MKQTGCLPTARCSLSGTPVLGHNKAYLFGGVYDEEHGEDDLTSTFYNDLFMLDMDENIPTWRLSILNLSNIDIHNDYCYYIVLLFSFS